MSFELETIYQHLRVCANCGCGSILRSTAIDLYCQSCWEELLSKTELSSSQEYSFKNLALFVWYPTSQRVGQLIYDLKNGAFRNPSLRLASTFAIKNFVNESSGIVQPYDTCIVVPPSSGVLKEDHAWNWGAALSQVYGFELAAPFEFATGPEVLSLAKKPGLLPQKRLGHKERFRRQFKLKAELGKRYRRFIFADDLITSGATAQAAYEALQKPIHFEVWTIARRPKLAGI